MDRVAVEEILALQSGVIARRQVHDCQGRASDIKRLVRGRIWVRVLPGVYLNHTGEPSWLQRAWIGVLFLWPAALAGESAIRAAVGAGWRGHDDTGPIEIAVAARRNVAAPPGYRRRRTVDFEKRVQWNTSPPRIRIEEAALDVAARQASELAAVATLADVCQSRATTASRILEAWSGRRRLRRGRWLGRVLEDIAQGACSVLERGYLDRVERAHALPGAGRQAGVASDRGRRFRDVEYAEFGLLVELDGRLFHDRASQRDLDLDRDLDAAVDGRLSVRLGWGQVFDRPCRTTEKVARLLQQRGWAGSPRRCGPDCRLPWA